MSFPDSPLAFGLKAKPLSSPSGHLLLSVCAQPFSPTSIQPHTQTHQNSPSACPLFSPFSLPPPAQSLLFLQVTMQTPPVQGQTPSQTQTLTSNPSTHPGPLLHLNSVALDREGSGEFCHTPHLAAQSKAQSTTRLTVSDLKSSTKLSTHGRQRS